MKFQKKIMKITLHNSHILIKLKIVFNNPNLVRLIPQLNIYLWPIHHSKCFAWVNNEIYLENPECPYSEDLLEEFSQAELSTSEVLKEWIAMCTNKDSSVIQDLQENHGEFLPSCTISDDLTSELQIRQIIGERDELGNFHGDAEIYFENGDYLWVDFVHGIKEGSASFVRKSGDHFLGNYKKNKLSGFVTETIEYCDRHNVKREVFYKVTC